MILLFLAVVNAADFIISQNSQERLRVAEDGTLHAQQINLGDQNLANYAEMDVVTELQGTTASPGQSLTFKLTRIGRVVYCHVPRITGTKMGTDYIGTLPFPIPAGWRPPEIQYFTMGDFLYRVGTDGTFRFYQNADVISGASNSLVPDGQAFDHDATGIHWHL